MIIAVLLYVAKALLCWAWAKLFVRHTYILFHELGHYLAVWWFGYKVTHFSYDLKNGRIQYEVPAEHTAFREFAVTVAGPLGNLVMAPALGLLTGLLIGPPLSLFWVYFAWENMCFGFNDLREVPERGPIADGNRVWAYWRDRNYRCVEARTVPETN